MKKHYREENDCLNCGTELTDKFCPCCGQENLQIRESFGHMMNHAISDYFHFDHQFFHTLKPLFLKPGKLTVEYMAGRRAQYLHPVKMYIFISIIYFLLLFQSGFAPVKITSNNDDPKVAQNNADSLKKALNVIVKNPNIPSYAKKALVKKAQSELDDTAKGKNNIENNTFMPPLTDDTTITQYTASQLKLPADERDNFLERAYNKKAFLYKEEYGTRAKEVFWDEFKHNIPKMMFLMLPLCALILRVTFYKSKKYYVEHLIYTFHLHCFLFLYLAVIMLIQIISPAAWPIDAGLQVIATVGIIWYLYRSLRVVYNRSPWRTITKIWGASIMYALIFSFCITLAFVLTTMTTN